MKRRYKNLHQHFPKHKNPHGRGYLCRYCGAQLPGRRTVWCSDKCMHAAYLECGMGVRHCVFERDKGVCAKCGLDTKQLQRLVHALLTDLTSDRQRNLVLKALRIPGGWRWFFRTRVALRRALWDADHVKPVSSGGGAAPIDGYQTLCVWCHKLKTAREARKRAKQRQNG